MPRSCDAVDEDLASTDEVKVYDDEDGGEDDDSQRTSETLTEEKLGLFIDNDEAKLSVVEDKMARYLPSVGISAGARGGGFDVLLPDQLSPFGYRFISSYISPMGAMPTDDSSDKLFARHPGFGLYVFNAEPPPAHTGMPAFHIDYKTGLHRYPTSAQLRSTSLCGAKILHEQRPSSTSGRSAAATCLDRSVTSSSSSSLCPFPTVVGHQPHINSSASLLSPSLDCKPIPVENSCRQSWLESEQRFGGVVGKGSQSQGLTLQHSSTHPSRAVKKPLNAFMLFMKAMRQTVIDEFTLKESAAVNQILGRRWHALDRSEQEKYYDMARKEKERHQQLYPGWSARDNYATHTKKKKRRVETTTLQLKATHRNLSNNLEDKQHKSYQKVMLHNVCRNDFCLPQSHDVHFTATSITTNTA